MLWVKLSFVHTTNPQCNRFVTAEKIKAAGDRSALNPTCLKALHPSCDIIESLIHG